MSLPTVIVLASGHGKRFAASGGSTHKLQARLAGKTVLQHTLDAVRASGLPWHLEDGEHAGMGDSIAAAVLTVWQANPATGGWLILPGDLPLVQSDTLQAIAAALAMHEVVVPLYQGRRGHPVGFAAGCRQALLNLTGKQGATRVVKAQAAIELIVNDVGCVLDIDTADDLQAAQALLQPRAISR